MDVVVQNPQKSNEFEYEKNVYVVTPQCAAAAAAAAAAVDSTVVLRRPTKEYTHPISMMHRRLPTAGVQVAPHYHQLLVQCAFVYMFLLVSWDTQLNYTWCLFSRRSIQSTKYNNNNEEWQWRHYLHVWQSIPGSM